jgi:hypothetical protein
MRIPLQLEALGYEELVAMDPGSGTPDPVHYHLHDEVVIDWPYVPSSETRP